MFSSSAISIILRLLAAAAFGPSTSAPSQADPVGICASELQNLPRGRPVGDLVVRAVLQVFLAIAHAFPRA